MHEQNSLQTSDVLLHGVQGSRIHISLDVALLRAESKFLSKCSTRAVALGKIEVNLVNSLRKNLHLQICFESIPDGRHILLQKKRSLRHVRLRTEVDLFSVAATDFSGKKPSLKKPTSLVLSA